MVIGSQKFFGVYMSGFFQMGFIVRRIGLLNNVVGRNSWEKTETEETCGTGKVKEYLLFFLFTFI